MEEKKILLRKGGKKRRRESLKAFSSQNDYDTFIFSSEKRSEKYLKIVHSDIEHLSENKGREKIKPATSQNNAFIRPHCKSA